MVTIYIYDIIQSKNKREYYRDKRKFYYNLSKLSNFSFLSKSVILTEDEDFFDGFFKSMPSSIICFKIKTNNKIERIK